MTAPRRLPFDPIERAGELWEERVGPAGPMRLATTIMRVQQIVVATLDATLKPFDITFARYEVLRLLSFSRSGSLPLSKIGERLMVHPTSVTNAIDRLVAAGLVDRAADTADRRRILASLTPRGREVLEGATAAIMAIDFGVGALDAADQQAAYDLLRPVRAVDFEA
ncbi:transcriptional regulator, MarR family [Aeromicrobium marinum DSM 15272]|uniref:Transcriptional regulator, MarR family n=1 Tax=Aeromicrobium marinum DSM 15272 TaxID=585531 RepID=E2SFC2_9ACTN|nr:MarR family transcriptional regulator [Aeromicrobium marinum]EFQ82207.1 transcriptional regulator, MarR family [Aeromicrobium marinum DSM 15272]